jgi:hypothetical protein
MRPEVNAALDVLQSGQIEIDLFCMFMAAMLFHKGFLKQHVFSVPTVLYPYLSCDVSEWDLSSKMFWLRKDYSLAWRECKVFLANIPRDPNPTPNSLTAALQQKHSRGPKL